MRNRIGKLCVILGCIPFAAQGQTVQGVKGTALWLQAAPVTDSLLNGSYHFHDRSGNELMLYAGTGTTEYTQARNLINTFNFNPAIDISKPDSALSTTFSHMGLQQATVIGVYATKTATQLDSVYQVDGADGITLITNKVIHGDNSSDLGYTPNLTGTLQNVRWLLP